MTAPRRRNQPPSTVTQRRVQVGSRHAGGELSAALRIIDGLPRIVVNASIMTGQAVDISLADAATYRDGLTALLEQAGYE